MPNDKKRILKQLLRDECLPTLGSQSKYYNTEAVRTWLSRRRLGLPRATLNRYLHDFRRAGRIYDAGRGWSSSLATPFTLNREPVEALAGLIQKQFRFLKFSCWSTDQVKSFMH